MKPRNLQSLHSWNKSDYDKAVLRSKCPVVGSCHLSLHACNQSLFALGLSIDSRAYVVSQHALWPIRTVPPTCANQDVWVVIITKRPKVNSIHTANWHAWTRTPPLNIVQKVVFSLIHYPASFICLWPIVPFWLGGSRHGWGLFVEQTTPYIGEHVSIRLDSSVFRPFHSSKPTYCVSIPFRLPIFNSIFSIHHLFSREDRSIARVH